MTFGTPGYGITRRIGSAAFEDVEQRVREALQREGFGVLTTIDVSATLEQKLGVSMPRYTILGACNPSLAHRALEQEPAIGLMLPCNVVLTEEDGAVVVSVADPRAMLAVAEAPLDDVAAEARERLERALGAA